MASMLGSGFSCSRRRNWLYLWCLFVEGVWGGDGVVCVWGWGGVGEKGASQVRADSMQDAWTADTLALRVAL
jgi:hypothetical protein